MKRSIVALIGICLILPNISIAITPIQHDPCDPNLVGWWKLDETSGTIAVDSKGGDNNGTIARTNSTVEWGAEGKFGTAVTLGYSGPVADGRIVVPLTSMRKKTGTVAFWAKIAPDQGPTTSTSRYFVGWQGLMNPTFQHGRVQIYLYPGTNSISIGLGDQNQLDTRIKELNTSQWYHIALTWQATSSDGCNGNYKFYVDGIEMPSGTMRSGYTPGTYKNMLAMADYGEIGNDRKVSPGPENAGIVGTIDEVGFYDAAISPEKIRMLAGADPLQAWNPSPGDGTTNQPVSGLKLSWSPGADAASHDVYIGTNFNEVNDANRTNPLEVLVSQNQDANSYELGILALDTTYYWRIDEINEPKIWKGNVWSFTTNSGVTYNPYPANRATYVWTDAALSWSSGALADTHDIYFGTDFNDVNDANDSWPVASGPNDPNVYKGNQAGNTFDPCYLEPNTVYYWRIDEVNGPNTWTGNVWSFTTGPGIAEKGVIRILSWNIEFLGTRSDPCRTLEQLDAIAQRILTFDASVLALQEIYDGSVLEYIRSRMGSSWKIYYAGYENALLYDQNKVELLSAEMLHNLNNPPYTSYPWAWGTPVSGVFRPVRMYAEPFRVIGIHCHWADADIRAAEGTWLRTKIIEFLEDPQGPNEIFLLGDLNGEPGTPPHPQLQEGNILNLLPKENGNSTHIRGGQIDHCYVTQAGKDRLPKQSAFVIRPEYYGQTPAQFRETYSDHYPIFIDFKPDVHTDFAEFAMFASRWLETGCNLQNNWCDRADLTGDGQVNLNDLREFVTNWLASAE